MNNYFLEADNRHIYGNPTKNSKPEVIEVIGRTIGECKTKKDTFRVDLKDGNDGSIDLSMHIPNNSTSEFLRLLAECGNRPKDDLKELMLKLNTPVGKISNTDVASAFNPEVFLAIAGVVTQYIDISTTTTTDITSVSKFLESACELYYSFDHPNNFMPLYTIKSLLMRAISFSKAWPKDIDITKDTALTVILTKYGESFGKYTIKLLNEIIDMDNQTKGRFNSMGYPAGGGFGSNPSYYN